MSEQDEIQRVLSSSQNALEAFARTHYEQAGRGAIVLTIPGPLSDVTKITAAEMVYREHEDLQRDRASASGAVAAENVDLVIQAVESYDSDTQAVVFMLIGSHAGIVVRWLFDLNVLPSMMPALESFQQEHAACPGQSKDVGVEVDVRFPAEGSETCEVTVTCACGATLVAPGLRYEGKTMLLACRARASLSDFISWQYRSTEQTKDIDGEPSL